MNTAYDLDWDDLAVRDNDFQVHDLAESDFRALLVQKGWKCVSMNTFYYQGEAMMSPNGIDYLVPRTFDEETFWWGVIASDPEAFAEAMGEVEVSPLEDDDCSFDDLVEDEAA